MTNPIPFLLGALIGGVIVGLMALRDIRKMARIAMRAICREAMMTDAARSLLAEAIVLRRQLEILQRVRDWQQQEAEQDEFAQTEIEI